MTNHPPPVDWDSLKDWGEPDDELEDPGCDCINPAACEGCPLD